MNGTAPLDTAVGPRNPPFFKMERKFGFGSGWVISTLLIAVLVGAPVAFILGHVFVSSGDIWGHLAQTVLPLYIVNSILLMIGVGACVMVGGVGTAWLVTMCRFPGRNTLEWALLLPMAMPAYVVAYTYTGLLDFSGPVQTLLRDVFGWSSSRDYWFPEIRSLGGAIAVMSLVLYPYVYLLARSAFMEQSVCVLEASRTLGRGPWSGFFKVALPLARPSIAAGTALALMETLNDFGTVHYFAVDTFTTGIYRTWLGLGEPTVASQLGAVLLLFVLALVIIERISRGVARFHHTTSRYRRLPGYQLSGWRCLTAQLFSFSGLFFGFVLPATILAWWSLRYSVLNFDFLPIVRNSFLLALVAALAAVSVGVVMAYAQRLSPSPTTRSAVRLASLGYAIPGSVIAVGTMAPLAMIDNIVATFVSEHFGVNVGMLLTGSIAALVYAYLVRFLAVSFNGIEASLAKVTHSMEAASRTLGQGAFGTLRRVHIPLIRGSLLTAGLLVFVDVMKELPATLIMRPFNFDTLAVRTFSLASDERLMEAAAPALVIVLVGLLPVIMLSYAVAKSRPGGKS
ncbi:putative Fe(3+)-transport system permease protein FbpB2 with binding-protein-dependent transport systems inner membrane component [Magnetospirillum sp. LM-5]|uniref:ABC transporter permease n=1 Tax=Magnetospirillum sp. LM-5 TaxID=2681466 RepID=UPI001384EDA5|nr:iron ABC transporter permease [Magnetospirillum sp. LM-5]CAA7619235.1 putative Fe(3+)-transport system permease protein FbpB2 with binding-protein-dependent transport systems inner membrane component [Magnetospirillum sp. LM-5]